VVGVAKRSLSLFPLKHTAQQTHRFIAEPSIYLRCLVNTHPMSDEWRNFDRTLAEQSTEIFQIVTREMATLKDADLLMLTDVKGVIDIEPSGNQE